MKTCRACSAELVRGAHEAARDYRLRESCDRTCARRGPRRRTVRVASGADFPGAHVQTLAELPDRCPRDGGLWRPVETGRVCVTCSYERVVAEVLRARLDGLQKPKPATLLERLFPSGGRTGGTGT